jgi:amino acid transporter
VNFTAPLFYLFLGLSAASLVVLRMKDGQRERPFRVPLYPLPPLVLGALSAVMLWSSVKYAYDNRSWTILWPVIVMLVGLVLARAARRRA